MDTMYWITRLDSIFVICVVIASVSGTILLGMLLWKWIDFDIISDEELTHLNRRIKTAIILSVVFGLISVFVPTTKDALIIYGVGGTLEWIKENDHAKELPDKAVEALSLYLDDITKDLQNEPKE